MLLLRGNSEAKIDEKGRLKIPAAFKKVLDEECPQTKFYVTSMDGKTARVYPIEEWTQIEAKLKSSFDPSTAELKFKVNYYGGEADMDSQGRVLIPQVLREKAAIGGEVAVMGMTTYLEVCTSDRAKQRAEHEFTPDDWKRFQELGI
jgi:MraZ protein